MFLTELAVTLDILGWFLVAYGTLMPNLVTAWESRSNLTESCGQFYSNFILEMVKLRSIRIGDGFFSLF